MGGIFLALMEKSAFMGMHLFHLIMQRLIWISHQFSVLKAYQQGARCEEFDFVYEFIIPKTRPILQPLQFIRRKIFKFR